MEGLVLATKILWRFQK